MIHSMARSPNSPSGCELISLCLDLTRWQITCEASPLSPLLLQNHLLQFLVQHLMTQLMLEMPQQEQAWAGHSSATELVEDLSESSSESDLWFSSIIWVPACVWMSLCGCLQLYYQKWLKFICLQNQQTFKMLSTSALGSINISFIIQQKSNILFPMQEDTGEVQTGIYSKIKGVLWGAVLGDVIGAFLEFSPNINEKRVNEAFSIKGGGQHKLQPGQPTDDSELAYSIAKGLIRGKGKLNLDFIAEQMGNWFMSKPIDIGGTIRKSVPKACNMKSHQAYLCRKAASQGSKQSQSNGTLMSIAPVAVWCHRLGPADIVRVVREYTILVHPNQLVVLANTFYTLMVVYLVNSEEVSPEAKTKAFLYAQQNIKLAMDNGKEAKQFLTWIEAIQEGLNEKTLLQTVSPVKNSGWVRVAFSYSIYQLLKGNSFRSSIFDILQLKGDTDTNACIAGGLLGAYYGFSGLQMEEQIAKINKWRPGKARRPDWLVPGLVIDKFVEDVIKCAPRELEIVGGELQK